MSFGRYIAKVKSVDKRRVTVESALLPPIVCDPMNFGHIKFRVPEVGDKVMVLTLDDTNQQAYYIPVGLSDELEDDTDTEFSLMGKSATELAVLGNTLKSKLETLIDIFANHTHPFSGVTASTCTAGGSTGTCSGTSDPASNASQATTVKNQLNEILSSEVKLK